MNTHKQSNNRIRSDSFTADQHFQNNIIFFRERNLHMLKKDLILRNPLRLLEHETEDILPEGGFGAVLSRAGVGKTAFIVQLALNNMLRDKNVLHISLNDPVHKVGLWYEETLRNIAGLYDIKQIDQLWEVILPHRFIMTFQVERFSVPNLEERLSDLTEQNIFHPRMMLIDGLPVDETAYDTLAELKTFAKHHGLHVWMTIRTHRHENESPEGMPMQIIPLADLFEVAIQLQPDEGRRININVLKGTSVAVSATQFFLDPATMLIKDSR